jgi:hydrogenase maturation protease
MSPDVVLATLSRLGGSVGRIRIVGCQPARPPGRRGAHPAVEAAVDIAVELCLELAADSLQLTG